MNKIILSAVLAMAIPSIAHAQASPTPPAKEDCCEKMKAEGKKCCCDDMKDHADHDMKGMSHDKK